MFPVLFSKEIKEQLRTSKLLIVASVLVVFGLVSPLLAKYTPEIMRSVPGLPAAIAAAIPEPTVLDSVAQYLKNSQQFGILLVVLFNMGAVAQEKERGTAAMLLSKPVSRSGWVLAKWLAANLALVVGLALGAAGFYAYNAYLFEAIDLGRFVGLNLLLGLFLSFHVTLVIFTSSLVKTQGMAAAAAFGGLALSMASGIIPRLSEYLPGKLFTWAGQLVTGNAEAAWGAVIGSAALMIGMLVLAALRLSREEI